MSFLSYLNFRSLSTGNISKFSIIDIIVLVSYYFFSLFFFLSLTGLFEITFIMAGAVLGFSIFLVVFRGRLEWKPYYLYLFIALPIIFAGIILLKGYFAGMGMNFYLPWAKEIVSLGVMPDDLVGVYSRMPLTPLLYAGFFSLLGFSHWVIASLPFFFSSATAILIYLWLLEKGITKNYAAFGVILLLTSPVFLELAMHPLQEPFVLFFATAFFYYLEKVQKAPRPIYFIFLFLSAVLAAVSKEIGIVLFLPLGWLLFKNRKFFLYFLVLASPLLIWLLRNYLIFDNPFSPSMNGIFGGRYDTAISISNRLIGLTHNPAGADILTRLIGVPVSYVLSFFSLIFLSFYGFFKAKKIQYISLFAILFLVIFLLESPGSGGFVRYTMPFLGLLIVYALAGLQGLKSRIFLSSLFFINLWGLFSTKLFFSPGQYISPVKFFNDYGLIIALALGLYFYFFISRQTQSAKYLLLFSASFYLARAEVFHVGRWFNVWLPIFSLVLAILVWKLASKIREDRLVKLAAGYIIILLVLNGWGMALAYFSTHGGFVFPNTVEAYSPRPAIADKIESIEGGNKDFYVLATGEGYFEWYRNFKTIQLITPTFHAITNSEYRDDLSSAEISGLFKKYKIKYVMYKEGFWPELEFFFDKIKSSPDLFEPIYQEGKFYLWQVM